MSTAPKLDRPRLQRALRALRGRRVAVIGDVMLDSFLWGNATRISPEAPIPVVVLEQQTWSLGGAANVAANITAMGGIPVLLAAVGDDPAGLRLQRMAARAGIEVSGLLTLPSRPTTIKYRVLARNKHLLRLDREMASPLEAHLTRAIVTRLAAEPDLEAVIVSDYAKGAVTPALVRGIARVCAQRQLPWCVDPKLPSLRYRDATVVKPNSHELELLAGLPARTLPEVRQAAARVLRLHHCQHVLVTRGELGMALFGADGNECVLAGAGQQVSDVTGAGDTVSALLGLGLAAALPLPLAAALANRAAGFVVSRPGIAVAHPGDLLPA